MADDKTMYLWVRYTTGTDYSAFSMHGFGEFTSFKDGDLYAPDGWFGMRRITFQKHA